jgi:D-alanyl-lipoteichoic acid acyltransferase DltB (MBOAT superfamily)
LSVLFNFFVGSRISISRTPKIWLIFGVFCNLACLFYFKYFNFFFDALQDAKFIHSLPDRIELPVGISFYTFTQVAYLVDRYRKKVSENDALNYALFVTFFPHLIAGPILHHAEMMPQFKDRRRSSVVENISSGIPMFAIGLFKKTWIADSVATVANLVFSQDHLYQPPNFILAWAAALAYALQIYFDFSGYSDMAIGISKMFGIDLPINFNSPYKAKSISDFWRRWHITLSRFLRDYLYIPLGGNRRGTTRRYVNLFLTMVLGGFWHGAGWTFILWGALHGAYLIIEQLWSVARDRAKMPKCPLWLAQGLTLLAVVFAWVPFRASNLRSTILSWEGMLGFGGFKFPSDWAIIDPIERWLNLPRAELGFNGSSAMLICLAFVACLSLPNSQQQLSAFGIGLDSPGYNALPPTMNGRRLLIHRTLPWALMLGCLLGAGLRAIGDYTTFIYFQF